MWDPLDSERRPFDRVGYDQIVEERRVLLPHSVLFLQLTQTRLVFSLLFRHFFSVRVGYQFPARKKQWLWREIREREGFEGFYMYGIEWDLEE